MKSVFAALAGFWLASLAAIPSANAQAVAVIDSNSYASIGAEAVYNQPIEGVPGPWAQSLAVPFATGSSEWDLNSVSIVLQGIAGSSSDLSVAVYSSGSNTPVTGYGVSYAPATEVALLTTSGSVSSLASYSFTPSTTVDLSANSTYWLVLTPSVAEPNEFYWYRGAAVGIEGQSLYNTNTGFQWSPWEITTDTNQALNFEAYGTVIPEPASYSLALGGAVCMAALACRLISWRARWNASPTGHGNG